MARKLYCDCCHHMTDETDNDKKDWSQVTFAAISTSAIYNKFDLCEECTCKVRALLQKGK